MLKKTITFEDYDGNSRTEDFYFNLSKAEIAEMEMSIDGGVSKLLDKIVETNDNQKIVKYFKEFILKSYGKKSLDGRRFMKSKEITDEFSQTEAYSQLFMELATDADKASEFVNGIIPKSDDETAKPNAL